MAVLKILIVSTLKANDASDRAHDGRHRRRGTQITVIGYLPFGIEKMDASLATCPSLASTTSRQVEEHCRSVGRTLQDTVDTVLVKLYVSVLRAADDAKHLAAFYIRTKSDVCQDVEYLPGTLYLLLMMWQFGNGTSRKRENSRTIEMGDVEVFYARFLLKTVPHIFE